MQRITPDHPWPLFDVAATRRIEQAAASLPPHTLMQRAGLATARLALALAPHARSVWIACGPGNNGGDGLEAAMHLQRWGKAPVVTWLGKAGSAPPDTQASFSRAIEAGVRILDEPPVRPDLVIDALLGIGAARPPEGLMARWLADIGAAAATGVPVLAVDLPSGLDADTGATAALQASHTLSLLTLKPGLFTGRGRDACGQVWFDDLGIAADPGAAADVLTHEGATLPQAWLAGAPAPQARAHASHKGSYGDVAVIGGAGGMSGAALLAGSAALHGGAGRVLVGLLDGGSLAVDTTQPELMLRDWATLDLAAMAVACGCGGGQAVAGVLPRVLSTARALVLDADALNAIAADPQLQTLLQARAARPGRQTVLTPHPLEAARLLGCDTARVQADRLAAASTLAQRFGCCVLLKGSGTVIAAPGRTPAINPTGNARLATAGTGDVLAGLIAARLGQNQGQGRGSGQGDGPDAFEAACAAAWLHGQAALNWPAHVALSAGALARALA